MGSQQSPKMIINSYQVEPIGERLSVLYKMHKPEEKFLMKTFQTASEEQHKVRLCLLKQHQDEVRQNKQLSCIVDIIEEKDDFFCSTAHKYSSLNMAQLIKQRRINMGDSIRKGRNNMRSPAKRAAIFRKTAKYFNYQDISNILYSCLSALWVTKQASNNTNQPQLKNFETVFLSTKDILIFGEGTLKITHPFLFSYQNRYTYDSNTYYSPEKLNDFHMVDDQKCAIFELAMALLEISLLQSMSDAYYKQTFLQEVAHKKLQFARLVYSADLQDRQGLCVFDLIQKMMQTNRQTRCNLQEAIEYAEQMYEMQESINQQIKKSVQSHSKIQQKEGLPTDHSSGKEPSPPRTNSQQSKESLVLQRNQFSSPNIHAFTIFQVSDEKEQVSSMLQSFAVQNPKTKHFSQSELQGGIFSNLHMGDSYNYGLKYFQAENGSLQQYKSKEDYERVFTDPSLLQTIKKELQLIQIKKKERTAFRQLKISAIMNAKNTGNLLEAKKEVR